MKVTIYFESLFTREDRVQIKMEWIQRVVKSPVKEHIRNDGRIRRWGQVPEMGGKYLRVVLLPDGEMVHNAFFDRGFER